MHGTLRFTNEPGRLIPTPDATSHSPYNHSIDERVLDDSDCISASTALARRPSELSIAASRLSVPKMQSVTWERVRDETFRDIYLIDMAVHRFPATPDLISIQLIIYRRLRDGLFVVDGVLMYKSFALLSHPSYVMKYVHISTVHSKA